MDRVTCREKAAKDMAVSARVRGGQRGYSAMAKDTYMCTCECMISDLFCSFAVP